MKAIFAILFTSILLASCTAKPTPQAEVMDDTTVPPAIVQVETVEEPIVEEPVIAEPVIVEPIVEEPVIAEPVEVAPETETTEVAPVMDDAVAM